MKIIYTRIIIIILISFHVSVVKSQSKWHPFIGLHGAMDGGGYYLGISGNIGVDYYIKKKVSIGTSIFYFPSKIDTKYPDGGFEKGKYRSSILALLIQFQLSKKQNKGFNLGSGIAIQRTTNKYENELTSENTKRLILVIPIRVGYRLPVGSKSICFELNAVGPHFSNSSSSGYYSQTLELLTQLSIGTRFVF